MITDLPGISESLLAPARRTPVSEQDGQLVGFLMKKIGLAPRRQREVGSWIIDEQPTADGEGWQDWPAFHHVDTERHARIRFYTAGQFAPSADSHARQQAVAQEFHLLSRLRYDGLQVPEDLVNEPELGIGLVFPQPKGDTPLDLWLAAHKDALALEDQLDLIARIADIVHYAHRNRVVHRSLNPRSVAVRERGSQLLPQVTDWDSAGILPANPDTAVSRLSSGSLSLMAAAPGDTARLFAAPEGLRPVDPARIDVFGLGALTFFILTGGQPPATARGELIDRLRRDRGLDLAAEIPQVRTALRQLVLDATNPSPAERIPDIATFLERLEDARDEVLGKSTDTDPLEAGRGAELAGGRFVYKRRLGAGSTAVAIPICWPACPGPAGPPQSAERHPTHWRSSVVPARVWWRTRHHREHQHAPAGRDLLPKTSGDTAPRRSGRAHGCWRRSDTPRPGRSRYAPPYRCTDVAHRHWQRPSSHPLSRRRPAPRQDRRTPRSHSHADHRPPRLHPSRHETACAANHVGSHHRVPQRWSNSSCAPDSTATPTSNPQHGEPAHSGQTGAGCDPSARRTHRAICRDLC